MKSRPITIRYLSLTFYCWLFLAAGCSQKPYYKETRMLMGTFVEITCQDKQAINEAFDAMKKIDTLANNFDPASEISQLNRQGKIKASRDMAILIKESLKYYSLSSGAFDITIAPLAAMWKEKIKEADEKKAEISLPSKEEIESKLTLVGAYKISVDETLSLIAFTQEKMAIDLGAIAKGYAVDKAVSRLKDLGIHSALVNAGGNIYCIGKKGARKWHIGIRHPRKPQEIIYYVDLENQAAATSGDYEQFFTADKKRYSHIIDPHTGYPVTNGIVSVTVIASDAATADALSTTVFVLGKEEGQELIKKIGNCQVRILEENSSNVSYYRKSTPSQKHYQA